MSAPILKVETIAPDPRLFQRDHNAALRDANRDTARFHHEKHIPLHFRKDAPQRYGYKPRAIRYQKLKDRLGLPPLVSPVRGHSGTSKRVLTTQRQVTGTAKQARLILRFPIEGGTGRLRLKKGQTRLTSSQLTIRQLVDEIEVVTADEVKANAEFTGANYVNNVQKLVDQGRVRKRIV